MLKKESVVIPYAPNLTPREVLMRDSIKEMLALYATSHNECDLLEDLYEGLTTILNLFNEGCKDCEH